MKTLTVIGRRWFRKTYGGTYCTAQIYVDGVMIHKTPRQYGYGDFYEQAAAEYLEAQGLISPKKYENGGHEPLWAYCSNNKIIYSRTVSDVSRQRDL